MICTLIVNSETIKNIYEKRDCLSWQPLTLISDEIRMYVDNTRNEQNRIERFSAYSLLYFAINEFFERSDKRILRDENGKPYFPRLGDEADIFFSISHSGGMSAVTISDEGECGVDIQLMPEREMSERIEKRFLNSFHIDGSDKRISRIGGDDQSESLLKENAHKQKRDFNTALPRRHFVYFAEPTDNGFKLLSEQKEIRLLHEKMNDDFEIRFLKKWTLCEAILKCFGSGFKDLRNLNTYMDSCDLWFSALGASEKIFGLSASVKK